MRLLLGKPEIKDKKRLIARFEQNDSCVSYESEKRGIAMIEDRETTLGQLATFSDQQRVQKELAALEGRLMRCRQALAKIERQIERQEKGF